MFERLAFAASLKPKTTSRANAVRFTLDGANKAGRGVTVYRGCGFAKIWGVVTVGGGLPWPSGFGHVNSFDGAHRPLIDRCSSAAVLSVVAF